MKGSQKGQGLCLQHTPMDVSQGQHAANSIVSWQDTRCAQRGLRQGSTTVHYTVHNTGQHTRTCTQGRLLPLVNGTGRPVRRRAVSFLRWRGAACCQHNSSRQGPGARWPYHARGREAGRGGVCDFWGGGGVKP